MSKKSLFFLVFLFGLLGAAFSFAVAEITTISMSSGAVSGGGGSSSSSNMSLDGSISFVKSEPLASSNNSLVIYDGSFSLSASRFETLFLPNVAIQLTQTPASPPTPSYCLGQDAEPNNKRGDADLRPALPQCNQIKVEGSFVSGEVESSGSYFDIFVLNKPTNGSITIKLSNVPTGRTYKLRLNDADNDPVVPEVISNGQEVQITLNSLSSGKYYVAVENVGASNDAQKYELFITTQ
ncbi:MAG: hypothetical protein AAGD96_22005 [Chloroflexota bacterium]